MNSDNNSNSQDDKASDVPTEEVWSAPPPPAEKEPIVSYDIPNTEGLSIDQAKSALGKISTDAISDKQHPYTTKTHPQHSSFVETVTALHKIKNPESEPQTNKDGQELVNQPSPEVVEAMSEAIDGQQAETDTAVVDAQEIVDKLVADYDFETFKVTPENLYQKPVWELQGHLQRENWPVLSDGIAKQLKDNKQTLEVQQLFTTFCAADILDVNVKREVAQSILSWISRANKQRLGK